MLRLTVVALILLATVIAMPGQPSRAAETPEGGVDATSVTEIPKFFDLVVDDVHGRLYGSYQSAGTIVVLDLPSLNTVATISLGQGSSPSGMSLSSDSAQLAVALFGAGNIALIDTATLTVTGYLQPTVEYSQSHPYDVRYGRPGRLYSVGNPASFGTDYVHTFDTVTRTEVSEIGIGHPRIGFAPRLAITADRNTLFVSESSNSPQKLHRFDITTDTPTEVSAGLHGPVRVLGLAARADGSAVYTSAGQVWSGDLQQMLGEFDAAGLPIEYVPTSDRLFVGQDLTSTIVEVDPNADYGVRAIWPVSGIVDVIRASTDGSRLYVSTDVGIDVIRLDLPTFQLDPQVIGEGGRVSGGGTYSLGSIATLNAESLNNYSPAFLPDHIFIGWTVDGKDAGWANPLTLTMDKTHTIMAHFVATAKFPDMGGYIDDRRPIAELASRGIIRGYQNGYFGGDDRVRRDQMAALIARATPAGPGTPSHGMLVPPACLAQGSWDCEDWGNTFTDPGGIDPNLWRNAGTLQHYGVVLGYQGRDCAARRVVSPCFGPGDRVTFAQTISFITRAMIAKGYWFAQPNAPQPYAGVPTTHATDFRTFHFYTGGIPRPVIFWNDQVPREWFAHALWAALDSYWGADTTMPDGRPSGGYTP